MNKLEFRNRVFALDPAALEMFVHKWVSTQLHSYAAHDRYGGANDLGRDVVGFVTLDRHDGEWDNFQCKRYSDVLSDAMLFEDLGKVLFHASEGQFTPPRAFFFVAPKGFNRKAERFLDRPSEFKKEMLDDWDKRCGTRIRQGSPILLTDELREVIEAFDFRFVEGIDIDALLQKDGIDFALADTFGADPGDFPRVEMPHEIHLDENSYVQQLVAVYGSDAGTAFANADEVLAHPDLGQHLIIQRKSYYEAAAFRRHYRDNIEAKHIEAFDADMHNGVFYTYAANKGLKQVNAVMAQAAQVSVSGLFGKHDRATVAARQGTCHHFANEGKMPWKP